jgi:molybdate transport system substrate-binding protein
MLRRLFVARPGGWRRLPEAVVTNVLIRRRSVLFLPLALSCSSQRQPENDRQLVVFAAASLRELFQDLQQDFVQQHRGAKIIFNFSGSQELRAQIENGAPADVYAAADASYVEPLRVKGLVTRSEVFTCNDLVVVVPKDNPARLSSFEQLPRAKSIVLGTKDLPVGKYAEAVLDRAGARTPNFRRDVEAKVVSRELTVKHVLAKVAMGEAEAGIVYRTDARASNQVQLIEIPGSFNVMARYPVALLTKGATSELAREWFELLNSEPAQARMRQMGFMSCAPHAD